MNQTNLHHQHQQFQLLQLLLQHPMYDSTLMRPETPKDPRERRASKSHFSLYYLSVNFVPKLKNVFEVTRRDLVLITLFLPYFPFIFTIACVSCFVFYCYFVAFIFSFRFYCELCKIYSNDHSTFQLHLAGKKHKMSMQRQQVFFFSSYIQTI